MEMKELSEKWRAQVATWIAIDGAANISLPASLTVRERYVLAWALHLIDLDATCKLDDIEAATGYSARAVRMSVAMLEERGLVRRFRFAGKPQRLRVALSRIFKSDAWKTCAHCQHPVVPGAAKPKYCATCMATIVRHDRQWKAHAFEIWASSKKESEAQCIYRIHVQTNQPLFTRKGSKDDADPGKEGVVNWMLGEDMIVDTEYWRARIKAYNSREDGED